MNLIDSINKLFTYKPRAFFIDEKIFNCKDEIDIVKSMNINVDGFSNFSKLLCTLRCSKNKYKIGIIHENGSKYSPQMLSNFIKKINPKIQIIIYKNRHDLKRGTKKLVLT